MKVVVGLGRGGGTQAALVPSHCHLSIVKSMTTLQLNSDNGGQLGGGVDSVRNLKVTVGI